MNVFDTIEFDDMIRYGIAIVVIFSALIAILYTIWGGFLMIISGGTEDKVKKAVNHIRHALIGIAFILLVLFIFPVFTQLMGLPYGDYAKPNIVFQTIKEITSRIFGTDIGSVPLTPTNTILSPNFTDL